MLLNALVICSSGIEFVNVHV